MSPVSSITTVMELPFNAANVCDNLRSLNSLTDQGDASDKVMQ